MSKERQKSNKKPVDSQIIAKLIALAIKREPTFLKEFSKYYVDFYQKLTETKPMLSPNEMHVCACLKIGLSRNEIINNSNNKDIKSLENTMRQISLKLNKPHNIYLRDHLVDTL